MAGVGRFSDGGVVDRGQRGQVGLPRDANNEVVSA